MLLISRFILIAQFLLVSICANSQDYTGRALSIYGSGVLTKGSDSHGNKDYFDAGPGYEFGACYSSAIKTYLRFNIGFHFLKSTYKSNSDVDFTYDSLGVIGTYVKTKFDFRSYGLYAGLHAGYIGEHFIYYCGIALGIDAVQYERTINFQSGDDTFYRYPSFTSPVFTARFGFGKIFGKNAAVVEFVWSIGSGSAEDVATVPFTKYFNFQWKHYGLTLKYDFGI